MIKKREKKLIFLLIKILAYLVVFTIFALTFHFFKTNDEYDKEFTLNPKTFICQSSSNASLLFIVFVIIAPNYFEKRDAIRATWGNKSITTDLRLVFTIGMSENETINKDVENEYKLNEDILRINMTDNYYNLTTKVMISLKWISIYCSNAKYILRINDDVIVNTHNLIRHFKNISNKDDHIFGFGEFGEIPARDANSKYFVSWEVYPNSTYDNFVDGI